MSGPSYRDQSNFLPEQIDIKNCLMSEHRMPQTDIFVIQQ